ncbi:MAG TPA: hypothetical protein VEK79_01740 [Thermoanaerobaculia bacterium]|nr:hypothetical protein [Thermoanaerobaculia bacterium]
MRPLALALSFLIATLVLASPQRSAEIAEQFTKTKHKNKERHGIKKSHYREVRSRVDVRSPEQYSGHYDAELSGTTITIEVRADGTVTGGGSDPRAFTLRDGRVRDALLTATKVYDDGSTAALEGAFLMQRVRDGKSPDHIDYDKTFTGLGIVNLDYQVTSGIRVDKLFYRRMP